MERVNQPLSRRAILKGIGVTICLPFLDSLAPFSALAAGKTSGKHSAPIRLAALYMPNGVNAQQWMPNGVGSAFELSPILSPLSKVKSEVLVFTELMNKASIEGDGHYVKVAPFLTGTAITKTTGSNLRCGGVSLDQLVAQHIGNMTPLPSLELSIESVTNGVDTNVGFTRVYGSHISWNTLTTPVTREVNPQLAFDRLFRSHSRRNGAATSHDASVLDVVMEDARSLQTKVGQADRLKLDEYFDAVRSVEKRIQFDADRRKQEVEADPQARREVEKLGGRIKDFYQDPARLSERGIDHTEQVRLMLDIMVLAFWTDSTRVATFMFGNEVSGKNFSFLPGVSGGHHEISHHENRAEKLAQYEKINQWHVAQFAYMLERMQAIKEGDGTLLDNCMVIFGSGMKDGNAHSPYNLPIVLGGRGGGTISSGRHLVYEKKTPLCNLYCSLLARMSVPAASFGDSTGQLAGIGDPEVHGSHARGLDGKVMDASALDALIKSKNLEERLRAVRLASRLPEGERQAPLLLLLRDRANYVAALAAEALGASGDWKSAGEMRSRFLWLSEDGPKRDPGCHIRSHLAYAFGRLEFTPGHDALRIGLRTVQIEAVGGVPFDTAASLRANCALALAHLHDPDAVREITPLLFDTGENGIDRILRPVGIAKRIIPEVRKKMAQALAATGDPVAVIPLGIKLRFPAEEAPEVLQECMQGLVSLGAENVLELLAPYLAHHDSHLAAFAALMIAQTGTPEAPKLLQSTIEELYGDPLRAVILTLSSLRSDEARSILHGVAEDRRMAARLALIEALHGSADEADRACLLRLADGDSYQQVREAARSALGTP